MSYIILGILIGWLVPRPKFIGRAEIAIWAPIKKNFQNLPRVGGVRA